MIKLPADSSRGSCSCDVRVMVHNVRFVHCVLFVARRKPGTAYRTHQPVGLRMWSCGCGVACGCVKSEYPVERLPA